MMEAARRQYHCSRPTRLRYQETLQCGRVISELPGREEIFYHGNIMMFKIPIKQSLAAQKALKKDTCFTKKYYSCVAH